MTALGFEVPFFVGWIVGDFGVADVFELDPEFEVAGFVEVSLDVVGDVPKSLDFEVRRLVTWADGQ